MILDKLNLISEQLLNIVMNKSRRQLHFTKEIPFPDFLHSIVSST